MSKKPSNIVAFPSLSSSLNTLPHATNMANIPVHPGMYAQPGRNKQSEALLQKAIQMNAQNTTQQSAYPMPAQGQNPAQAALMMRKPQKSK